MSRTVITLINPVLKIADTEAGLGAGTAYECQLTSAALVPTPNTTQIPATGCAPVSNVPGLSSWELQLAWLQDWTAPGGGLSNYAIENEGQLVWYSFTIDLAGSPTTVATGQAYVAAGQYGGVFGGAPAVATANWPCFDTPAFVVPAVTATLEADTEPADAELADA